MSVVVSVKSLPDSLQRVLRLPADQQLLFKRGDLAAIENGTMPDKLSFGHPELHSAGAAQLLADRRSVLVNRRSRRSVCAKQVFTTFDLFSEFSKVGALSERTGWRRHYRERQRSSLNRTSPSRDCCC
jgi:hypothetical protein